MSYGLLKIFLQLFSFYKMIETDNGFDILDRVLIYYFILFL